MIDYDTDDDKVRLFGDIKTCANFETLALELLIRKKLSLVIFTIIVIIFIHSFTERKIVVTFLRIQIKKK